MPIRVTCSNCGKQFSAWDDLVGKVVQCPKCQQKMMVAGPNPQLETPVAAPSKAPRPKDASGFQLPPQPIRPVSPVPRAGTPPQATTRSSAAPPPAAPLPRPAAPLPRQVPHGSFGAVSADLDDDDTLPLGCPKCNAPMKPNDDLCDACGYHLVLKKVIDISDMKKPNTTTGFERMFQAQLHESDSSHTTLLLMKVVGAIVLVGLLFMCLGQWWWIGVLAVAGGGAFYWAVYRKRAAESSADESSVNQDPLSAALWSMMLSLQRITGWRKWGWPFPCVAALTLRDATFGDDELQELQGLGDIEALDLEGTGITNDGLRHLSGLKRLRFLVLRRTKVTPAVARRLQLDLPQTMIWY